MELTKEFLIKEHIVKGKSAREIARELECSHTKIIKRMKKYNIKNCTDLIYNQYGRKYEYDNNYFEEINTQDKAYWLGFIWADGYIYESKKQRRLRIALKYDDRKHLEKFRESLRGNMDIKEDTVNSFGAIHPYVYIDINSSKLCDDLIRSGVIQYKENRKNLPNIKDELIPHFLRGLIDADGTIQIQKTKHKDKVYEVLTISFVGNKEFLENIQKYIESKDIIFTDKCIAELQGTCRLSLYKREYVLQLLKIIYKDANNYMPRKKEIYTNFLQKI